MDTVLVRTTRREELVNVTEHVEVAVARSGIREGVAVVWVPHTTAGVTVNEGADPSVARDLLAALARLAPLSSAWEHREGNSDAHVKATLVGSSVAIPVHDGALALGTWQAVFFCEFDGPRQRRMAISVLAG
ncbi:secondary thiamine-phosphate synthase enzyme YjbQ [Coriobacteriia bacterium Es71-Z0120]|uniref:secondary thiamine-phosphate synthase enzyme YjbQ n=1 Tax=Parvivirga hydrogeniphila TaxID=2939460 RepID=UPI002260F195|nr:secondary thiamine-phosphate synthase enzyme YjbQ [Parvivirga hydrogeniphila]MCL4078202.1 secondary thiamine-phosphate synthase enzyme YjbQ [Parvivirga hydrogeniphila]